MQDEADAYDAPVDGFDKPMDIDLNSDDGEILQPQLQQEEQRQDGEETSAQDLSYEDLLIQQYAEKQTYEAKANEVSRQCTYIHVCKERTYAEEALRQVA